MTQTEIQDIVNNLTNIITTITSVKESLDNIEFEDTETTDEPIAVDLEDGDVEDITDKLREIRDEIESTAAHLELTL